MERSQTESPSRYDGLDRMLIGGRWRAGASDKRGKDVSPWTGEPLLELALADAHDVDEAYRTAEQAQRDWANATPEQRSGVLYAAARILDERRDEICQWLVREAGSTRKKAELEHSLVKAGLLKAASFPSRIEGRMLPASIPGKDSYVYRAPVGVVGVIAPWNFPLQLANRSVAPALATGNAVVLKPASDTPVSGGILLGKIFEEAGLPPGVLSVVCGSGSEIGDAFVTHPVPRVLSFTGSTPVGKHLAELAGREVKRVCLELGGNGPFIVLDDADLERAVDAAVFGKFFHQGQICMAINRLLVDRAVLDEFTERFVARVRMLKAGERDDEETIIGPIINGKQLDSIRDKVRRTVEAGARVRLDGGADGLVLRPIVLDQVSREMPAAREELFGPVAPILAFDGDEEAIELANDTELGLSSAVYTGDLARGVELARRIEAGMTHVNDSPVNDEPNTAFGGVKQSGLGRFGGAWAIEEFTSDHWISVQREPRIYPTDGPSGSLH